MEQEVVETGGHLGGMTFGTFLLDALFIFFFVVWFWILIRVLMDLFRRKDMSGVSKVLWVIFLVVLPYIGIFAYLLTQGWSMGERDVEQAEAAREQIRSVVGFSVADEITKLDAAQGLGLDHRGRIPEAARQADLSARGGVRRRPSRRGARPYIPGPCPSRGLSDVRHASHPAAHHRLRAGRLHRGGLRRAGDARADPDPGHPAGRAADDHHRGRELARRRRGAGARADGADGGARARRPAPS